MENESCLIALIFAWLVELLVFEMGLDISARAGHYVQYHYYCYKKEKIKKQSKKNGVQFFFESADEKKIISPHLTKSKKIWTRPRLMNTEA